MHGGVPVAACRCDGHIQHGQSRAHHDHRAAVSGSVQGARRPGVGDEPAALRSGERRHGRQVADRQYRNVGVDAAIGEQEAQRAAAGVTADRHGTRGDLRELGERLRPPLRIRQSLTQVAAIDMPGQEPGVRDADRGGPASQMIWSPASALIWAAGAFSK